MKLEELGRRAVACPRWRWMPGMAVLRYHPGTPFHGQRRTRVDDDLVTYEQALNVHIMPDLTDPATLGCLLHLVREAWSAPHAAPQWDPRWQHWAVLTPHYDREYESWRNLGADNTEAEALVVALEAAP